MNLLHPLVISQGGNKMSEEKAIKPTENKNAASVKRMQSAADASQYQREWFKDVHKRVSEGEPFAFVNADVPMEILRAMDIPFLVNQWWASLCSAKQMSGDLFGLMKEEGYPDDICNYCSMGLAAALDPNHAEAAWGGMPKPTIAIARYACDSINKLFELYAQEYGIPFYPIENTVPINTPDNWWKEVHYNWNEFFEKHRLDFMVEELKGLIRFLEQTTGKMFSETKLREVMDLINQQEEYYQKARDLIAKTKPAPVGITDTVPSVMIPQWQRGTKWAVESAKKFYEEVKDAVDKGIAVCPNERARLMWIGRGLWFNLGFYQYFEKKYDAAFIWSMYLGIAADGYLRYGDDPLRALASRFCGMEEFLHMPPWNTDWFIKAARENDIDGVVYLVPDNCTNAVEGSYFIVKALEDAGIPVLMLRADPVNAKKWNPKTMTEAVEDFLENRLGIEPNPDEEE